MIKGVIFDLDGVLVSTDEQHFRAWRKLALELGIDDFTMEDNQRQRGVSRMESLEVVLRKGNKKYSDEEKTLMAEGKNTYYREMLQEINSSVVLDGAVDSLKLLRKKGILIGVGSASKNTPLILEKTGLSGYIDKVSCGLDITRSKPDPEVFQVAAGKLDLKPEECLVVEDSSAGITAAKAANMKSLGVGPYHKSLGADFESETLDIDWDSLLKAAG